MARFICRFYPSYTNAPKDVSCEWEDEAKCCRDWFRENGVSAEVVKQTVTESFIVDA